MPALQAFAGHSLVFERAYSPMPFTLAAHAAMLTGIHPAAAGVINEATPLPPGVPTVASLLKNSGYQTAGIVTNDFLDRRFGLAQGFDSWELLPHQQDYAPRVVARAFEELDRLSAGSRPFFLFLHFNDPHSDFPGQGTSLPYFSRTGEQIIEASGLPPDAFCPAADLCGTELLVSIDRGKRQLAPAELTTLQALYWAGVADLDTQIAPLLTRLLQAVITDGLTVLLTSDHGEEFLEHGKLLHSQIYDECVRVPLLVAAPGIEPASTQRLVGLQDVGSTILALGGYSANSLLEPHPLKRAGLLLQDKRTWERDRWALRTERWKLVAEADRNHLELYDLNGDPAETFDRSPNEPEVAQRLRQGLIRGVAELRLQAGAAQMASRPVELTEEESRRLQALGYLR
jgi:arylsulfatase A-like enzyme